MKCSWQKWARKKKAGEKGKEKGKNGKEIAGKKIKFDTGGHSDDSMHSGGGTSSGLQVPTSSLSLLSQIKKPPQSLSSLQVVIFIQDSSIHWPSSPPGQSLSLAQDCMIHLPFIQEITMSSRYSCKFCNNKFKNPNGGWSITNDYITLFFWQTF